MCLLLCIWTALLLGLIYAFFTAFVLVFREHGFTTTTLGCSFLGIGIGEVLGVLTQPLWNRRYRNYAKKHGSIPPFAGLSTNDSAALMFKLAATQRDQSRKGNGGSYTSANRSGLVLLHD